MVSRSAPSLPQRPHHSRRHEARLARGQRDYREAKGQETSSNHISTSKLDANVASCCWKLKQQPNFQQLTKSIQAVFSLKRYSLKQSKLLLNILTTFCKKICHQETSKIAQSGHSNLFDGIVFPRNLYFGNVHIGFRP